MRLRRPILVAFVATALVAYVFDCSGSTTHAEAMKCCQSMPCSSSGHSQECCETMPQMHAPFVPSPSAHGVSFTPDLIAVLSIFSRSPQFRLRRFPARGELPRADARQSPNLQTHPTLGRLSAPRSTTSIPVS